MEEFEIALNGNNLKLADINNLMQTQRVKIVFSPEAMQAVSESRRFLEEEISSHLVYGVNTGFGPMAKYTIANNLLLDLQRNLIRSHAVGMGKPLPDAYVFASMLVRLNTLTKGSSGVTHGVLERLKFLIENKIIPVVPEYGSVGTSGDLVHLAHIALAVIGEGDAMHEHTIQPVSRILKKFALEPYTLQAKEGLSLINGTSFMTGVAALACLASERLLSTALRLAAMSFDLVHCHTDVCSPLLHALRPHPGQLAVASHLRSLVSTSLLLRNDHGDVGADNSGVSELREVIQEIYSIRCVAQILGPYYETHFRVKQTVEIEMNSVTDNPVVAWQEKKVLHGGNFHGEYIAACMDELRAHIVKLLMLSERRLNFLLHSKLNGIFPPFLNRKQPGLTLALQGLQFVATSVTSQSQSLAFPHRVHSIPTNADNQDVVSMGTDAAFFTMRVIENAYHVLAIELVTLAQAVDLRGEASQMSRESLWFYHELRKIFPVIDDDRFLSPELANVVQFLKSSPKLLLPL